MGSTGKKSGGTTAENQLLKNFRGMSVWAAAELVQNAPEIDDPLLNASSPYQSVVQALDLHGKPVVLDDETFDKSVEENAYGGTVLYRGLGNQKDTAVMDSVKFGDKFYVGTGIYGDGLYFSNKYRTAQIYGHDDNKHSILTAYLDKNKVQAVDHAFLKEQFRKEDRKVRRLFSKSDTDTSMANGLASYALYHGYNVIIKKKTVGENYYIVLDRSPLVFRNNTEQH